MTREMTVNLRPQKGYNGVPQLPHDKDFHIFLCYESGEVKRIRIIVNNLEKEGFKCCNHDRDFLPGEMIMDNIKIGISRSLCMLVVLTEDFHKSRFCEFEMKQALQMHIENSYMLISIKLEPCIIPDIIKDLTYINAEEELIERVHSKVIKAIVEKEVRKEQVKMNGESRTYPLKLYKHGKLSLSRYRLHIGQRKRQVMWDCGFEISNEVLHKVEELVNSSGIVKYKHIYQNRCKILAIVSFLLLQITTVVFLTVLVSTSDNKPTDSIPPAGYIPIVCVHMIVIWWFLCGYCGCPKSDFWSGEPSEGYVLKFDTQEQNILNSRLWDKVTGQIGNRTIIMASFHKNCLRLMKYNMMFCKDFFVRQLTKREELLKFCRPQESYEEYTDRVFETFLRKKAYMLHDSVTKPPGKGHTIATGGKCACLLVDEWLIQ